MLAREKQNQLSGEKFPTKREIEFELAIARHMINVGIDNDLYHGKNPFSHFDIGPINNERKRVIIDDEYFLLLKESPEHFRPVIVSSDGTGMRKSESLLSIYEDKATSDDSRRFTMFDMKKGIISIPNAQGMKTGARSIPMPPILMQVLRKEREKFPDCQYIFTYDGKNQLINFRTCWENLRRRTNLTDVHFHDFRASFVTRKAQEGTPIPVIMELAGIKTLDIFKRYNLLGMEQLFKAMGREMPGRPWDVSTRGRHYAIWKVMGIKCKCCDFSDMK